MPFLPTFINSPVLFQRFSPRHVLPLRSTCAQTQQSQRCCPPPQMGLIPLIPNWITLAAWAYGAYRFYLGFNRTSYQASYRIPLALMWPLLFAFNARYRKNFTKSIKGSDEDY